LTRAELIGRPAVGVEWLWRDGTLLSRLIDTFVVTSPARRWSASRIIDDCHQAGLVTTTSKVPVFGELERTITAASDAP